MCSDSSGTLQIIDGALSRFFPANGSKYRLLRNDANSGFWGLILRVCADYV